jgi:hypothetical protein
VAAGSVIGGIGGSVIAVPGGAVPGGSVSGSRHAHTRSRRVEKLTSCGDAGYRPAGKQRSEAGQRAPLTTASQNHPAITIRVDWAQAFYLSVAGHGLACSPRPEPVFLCCLRLDLTPLQLPAGLGCETLAFFRHATEHFHATGHPIIEDYDPPEGWGWCYGSSIFQLLDAADALNQFSFSF